MFMARPDTKSAKAIRAMEISLRFCCAATSVEEKVMIDGYTKTILTVIAALLFILAIQQIVGPASAQIGSQCGYQRDVPCYIMIIPSPNPTL
jgi:hypothetical protein